MRIFNSCIEMYEEAFRELFKRGQTVFDKTVQGRVVGEKDYEQKEIVSYSYMLNNFDDLDEMMILAKKNFEKEHLTTHVAEVWFNDMIHNPTTKEKWWDETEYTKKYFKKFCDEGNGFASYGYGERIIPQLQHLINRLKKNIYSRGAVIAVYDNRDVARVGRRIPCTVAYHFIARKTVSGDKLNMIINQRSCDAINFFPLDIYKAYLLLKYIANEIGIDVGYIIHNIDSFHVYKMDVPQKYTW